MARHRRPAVIRKREGNPGKRKIVGDLPGLGKPVMPATKNPAFSVMRQAAAAMELCGSALGLSPYARTRIPQPDPADNDDPLAAFARAGRTSLGER